MTGTMKAFLSSCLLIALFVSSGCSQKYTINVEDVTNDVTFLASDELKGRYIFTPELDSAASYIANEFKKAGLKEFTRLRNGDIQFGDVITAIREQNVEVSAGSIGAPPVPEGQTFQYTIKTKGRLTSADEFGDIVIRTGEAGSIVRVKDIARVELGAQYYAASGYFESVPATVIGIYQAPGANALAVSERVQTELDRLSRAFPTDVEYQVPFNTTDFVQQSRRSGGLAVVRWGRG